MASSGTSKPIPIPSRLSIQLYRVNKHDKADELFRGVFIDGDKSTREGWEDHFDDLFNS